MEAAGPGILSLVPDAAAKVGRLVRNPPVAGEDEAQHQLGHRDAVLAWTIGDEHAEPRGGPDVDRVDARARRESPGASPAPASSAAAFTFLPRTMRTLGSNARMASASPGARDIGRVLHVAAELAQAVEPYFFELVGD